MNFLDELINRHFETNKASFKSRYKKDVSFIIPRGMINLVLTIENARLETSFNVSKFNSEKGNFALRFSGKLKRIHHELNRNVFLKLKSKLDLSTRTGTISSRESILVSTVNTKKASGVLGVFCKRFNSSKTFDDLDKALAYLNEDNMEQLSTSQRHFAFAFKFLATKSSGIVNSGSLLDIFPFRPGQGSYYSAGLSDAHFKVFLNEEFINSIGEKKFYKSLKLSRGTVSTSIACCQNKKIEIIKL